jgi:ribokinase
MATIFISGLINIETTVQVDGFPIDYSPVRYPFFGVRSTISGGWL